DIERAAVAADDGLHTGVGLRQHGAGEVLRRQQLAAVEIDIRVTELVLVAAQALLRDDGRLEQQVRYRHLGQRFQERRGDERDRIQLAGHEEIHEGPCRAVQLRGGVAQRAYLVDQTGPRGPLGDEAADLLQEVREVLAAPATQLARDQVERLDVVGPLVDR